nr:leucine-rich repeat domain-containing protein [uncultured Prevotella sp.]
MKNLFTLKTLFLTTVFMLFCCLSIQAADDELITKQVTVKLDKAGTLPDKIGSTKKYKITNLKIVGELNGTDWLLIRDMAGGNYEGRPYESEGKLATLDLSDAKIVSGGENYFSGWLNGELAYTSKDVLGAYAFYGCTSLVSLILPKDITKIGEWAFYECSKLTDIAIPASVTSIGKVAFSGCSGLTSLSIHSGVTSIGGHAFYNCSGLTSIYVYAEKMPKLGANMFDGCDAKNCKVYVPKGTYDDYWLSEFGYFENIVEFDATGIDKVTTSTDANELSRYSVNGQRLSVPTKGLNIVKYSDGSVKKVFVQ